ncbi:MAG: shikimate dehydrogenase [Oscillospiraceae bacterium]
MSENRAYCVLGYPLKHTMSPPIHKRLFELRGRAFSYCVKELPPEVLAQEMPALRAMSGFNVTIPHKVGIIPLLDELDETAARYGAVNCVCTKNGVSRGYNTDVDGFLRGLSAAGGTLTGSVLLLGSGGVGRMMAIEATRAGGSLTIAVREQDLTECARVKADIAALVPDAQVTVTTLSAAAGSFDTLINATPLGMYPHLDGCAATDDVIARAGFVFDAVYNPGRTALLKKADALGIKNAGGMAMLVWQAVSAHEIWDGDSYADAEVEAIIREMEEQVLKEFPV